MWAFKMRTKFGNIFILGLTFTLLLYNNSLYSQVIEWKELDAPSNVFDILKANKLINDKNESLSGTNKAILVFKSNTSLTFSSSFENINQPKTYSSSSLNESDYFYILPITAQAQKIILTHDDMDYKISFSQPMEDNSLAALEPNQIRFFEVNSKMVLEYYNITENERSKGNNAQPVGPNVSDALIIIKTFPPKLPLEVNADGDVITKLDNSDRGYSIFLKTDRGVKNNYIINLFDQEIGNTQVKIYELQPKELRYYMVKKPGVTTNVSNINNLDDENSSNFKAIDGSWSGSTLAGFVHVQLQTQQSKNDISGVIFKDDIPYNFKGVIKPETNNEFTISIETVGNKLVGDIKEFQADLYYKKGILVGYLIEGKKDVTDLVLLKNSKPDNLTDDSRLLSYEQQFKQIVGRYMVSKDNSFIKEIVIDYLLPNNQISGYLIQTDGKISPVSSKIKLIDNGYTADFNYVLKGQPAQDFLLQLYFKPNANYVHIRNSKKAPQKLDLIYLGGASFRYSQISPTSYDKIKNNITKSLLALGSNHNNGEIQLNYHIDFDKKGNNNSIARVQASNQNITNELNSYFYKADLGIPLLFGKYVSALDTITINYKWSKSILIDSYNKKTKNSYTLLVKNNLPYGDYVSINTIRLVNGKEFVERKINKYQAKGPINAFGNLILPGWGTRMVSYREKNGWGGFTYVVLPALFAGYAEYLSQSNYNKYLNETNNVADANGYYNNALMYRKLSHLSLSVSMAFYIYDFSWAFKKGIQNKRNEKKINDKLKTLTSPIYIRNDNITF